MEFNKTAIPTTSRSGRTPLHNPFIAQFPADDNALEFVIETGRDSLEARRAIRQVRQAARSVGRSGRVSMVDLPSGACEFTVWTVDKITRPAKAAAADTE